jgi:hypothetical protein
MLHVPQLNSIWIKHNGYMLTVKVKLPLGLINQSPHYEDGLSSGGIPPPLLTSALDGSERSGSRPCCWIGSRADSLTGNRTPTTGRWARSLVAIPAELYNVMEARNLREDDWHFGQFWSTGTGHLCKWENMTREGRTNKDQSISSVVKLFVRSLTSAVFYYWHNHRCWRIHIPVKQTGTENIERI